MIKMVCNKWEKDEQMHPCSKIERKKFVVKQIEEDQKHLQETLKYYIWNRMILQKMWPLIRVFFSFAER